MVDWNVVVSVYEQGLREAWKVLRAYGPIDRTGFYNVLVMKVKNTAAFLEAFARRVDEEPGVLNFVSRVIPAARTFDFTGPEDFEARARDVVLGWVPRLAGLAYHVRMHKRDFKGELSSQKEERFLDTALLDALESAGAPGRIGFEAANAVIDVETVGYRAGMSLWMRDDLARYPFLKVD